MEHKLSCFSVFYEVPCGNPNGRLRNRSLSRSNRARRTSSRDHSFPTASCATQRPVWTYVDHFQLGGRASHFLGLPRLPQGQGTGRYFMKKTSSGEVGGGLLLFQAFPRPPSATFMAKCLGRRETVFPRMEGRSLAVGGHLLLFRVFPRLQSATDKATYGGPPLV